MDSKDTLFGKVPNDWSVKSIGSIFTLSQGLQISKNLRSNTQKENYVPLLKITDLPKKVFSEYVTNIDKQYLASKNNIIYTRTGNVGLVYTDIEGCVHNNCFQIHIDNEFFDKYYVYYYLKSPQVFEYSNQVASGSVQKDLTHPSFKSCIFGYPNKKEQQKIASILSSLDDKIELNTAINQTLEAMAQTIFKSWFVDFEPFKEGEFIESELGMIPEGWSISSFSDTIDIIGGGTPKTTVESYWDGDIPWYSVVDAPSLSDTYVIDTNKKITQLGLENSSAKIVEENITIISARGTVGKIALTGQPMTFNQSCYALQHKVGNYYGYFSTQKLVESLRQRAHGSVFDTITKDTFKSVITVAPDKNVIKKFEILVEPIMKQIKNNLLQTQTLTKLRDTLLPKLMNGEVRV